MTGQRAATVSIGLCASVLVAMAMGVLLVAGAKLKYIALISAMSVATVVAAVISGIVNRYQLRRIEAFFNQDSSDAALRDYIAMDRMETTLLPTLPWR